MKYSSAWFATGPKSNRCSDRISIAEGSRSVVLVTGSAGLIGAESVRFFAGQGFDLVGNDNDMRRVFFGNEASTAWSRQRLEIEIKKYRHM
jgi:hypothetical protein